MNLTDMSDADAKRWSTSLPAWSSGCGTIERVTAKVFLCRPPISGPR